MAKMVILMPLAEANYNSIVDYLITKWGSKAANDFIDRLTQVIGYISTNPEIYTFADKLNEYKSAC